MVTGTSQPAVLGGWLVSGHKEKEAKHRGAQRAQRRRRRGPGYQLPAEDGRIAGTGYLKKRTEHRGIGRRRERRGLVRGWDFV